jgi:hypothetical protein
VNIMHTYSVCGLTLSSNVPLPELSHATCFVAECKFHLLPSAPFSSEAIRWFHQWRIEEDEEGDEKEPWVRFARYDDGYLLRFPSCGDFIISQDATEVRCRPLPDIPHVTLRHLLLDQVVPLVLSRNGRVVFHASAVSTDSGVIAFAGKSGRGKSIMALAFAREGHDLITDDCLALQNEEGTWMVSPGYPGVRLWGTAADELVPSSAIIADVAHYTSKRRIHSIDGIRFSPHPQPMRALFVLSDEQPDISIHPLKASRAFMAWAEYAYNLDILHADFLRGNFEAIGALATQIPAYAVNYPRDFTMLPAVRMAMLKQLEEMNNDSE